MTLPLIRLLNVSKVVETSDAQLTILNGISFDVKAGESLALIGASGSGKSTLLGLMAGLDLPSRGSVCIAGRQLELLDEEARADLRRDSIGFVFQNFMLMPALSALENVMLPAEIKGDSKAKGKATALLHEVGLSHRLQHFPAQLSGGEQQRVAIARAFMFRDERYPAKTGSREQGMFRDERYPAKTGSREQGMFRDERYPAKTGSREQGMFRDERYPAKTGGREQGMSSNKEGAERAPEFILLCDEPTGNLDAATGEHIADLLFELNTVHATTLVIVTHDNALASRCQRQLKLHAGELMP